MSNGLPVDAAGNQAIDPTQNVKDLFRETVRGLSDLRKADHAFMLAEIHRLEQLLDQNNRHQHELRVAEKERLDAIRQVDREDVLKTTTQAVNTAETLRTQVVTTASTEAAQRSLVTGEMNKRISALELALSEGKGKQTVADPMMEKLMLRMESLLESRSNASGARAGVNWIVVVIVGAVSFVGTILGIAGVIWGAMK